MWALQAWGELALGLAAPRAVHAAGNDYGNQTLAWDVVRESFMFLFFFFWCYAFSRYFLFFVFWGNMSFLFFVLLVFACVLFEIVLLR